MLYYSSEEVLENLQRLGIDRKTIDYWEKIYAITVPKDSRGKKIYVKEHIKLFKNIKKLLALGYSVKEIPHKLNLSDFKTTMVSKATTHHTSNPMKSAPPPKAKPTSPQTAHEAYFVNLIERLMDEKSTLEYDKDILTDRIHQLELEKQNLISIKFAYEEDIEVYVAKIEELETDINALHVLKNQALAQKEELETSIRDNNLRFSQKDLHIDTLEDQIINLQEELKSVKAQKEALKKTNNQWSTTLSDLQAQLEGFQSQIIELEEDKKALETTISDQEQELLLLAGEKGKLESARKEIEKKFNNLENDSINLIKLNDDLEEQLIAYEDKNAELIDHLESYKDQIDILEHQKREMFAAIEELGNFNKQEKENTNAYIGSWTARSTLVKSSFNSIDINIPKEKTKTFKIAEVPKRKYGSLVVLVSTKNYPNDPLWKKVETYKVALLNEEELAGELDVEYYIDEIPVAKALYTVQCHKLKDKIVDIL